MVQDDWTHPEGQVIPRDALIRYREWYGTKDPAASGAKGLKMTADEVGQGIVRLERDDPKIGNAVLDPRAFAEDGGPSIAERLNSELIKAKLMAFRKAGNSRTVARRNQDAGSAALSGLDMLRARMIGVLGKPMIYCFDTCVASIRTIPSLQHDLQRPEDTDPTPRTTRLMNGGMPACRVHSEGPGSKRQI